MSLPENEALANESLSDDPDLLNDLKNSMNLGSFHIIHLYINSIFNKFVHIFDILGKTDIDILALNEIKLKDSYISHSYMKNDE